MKKKILIIIGIIIGAILALITYFVVSDLKQEDKLRNELIEISNLVNEENIDTDKVYKRLDTLVTKDDYKEVEKSFKSYLKDSFDNSMLMLNLLNDEKITNILTVENYKKDGKNFKETKEYIKKTIKDLEECKNKYYEFLTEGKAMSYINNKNLDSYYIDFYKEEILKDIDEEKNDKTIEESINDVISLLQNSEKVIDFLIENKNSWSIEGDNISFNSDSLIDKYNKLINEL